MFEVGSAGRSAVASPSRSACHAPRLRRRGAVVCRQQLLLAFLDLRQVRADHALRDRRRAFACPSSSQTRLVAEPLDEAQRVRDEQNRLAAALELGKLVEALVREALVADREHFVDQQHVRDRRESRRRTRAACTCPDE